MALVKINALRSMLAKIKRDIDERIDAAIIAGKITNDPSAFIENFLYGRGLPAEIQASEIAFLLNMPNGLELFDRLQLFEDRAHVTVKVVETYNVERRQVTDFLIENSIVEPNQEGTLGSFMVPDVLMPKFEMKASVPSQLLGEMYELLDSSFPEADQLLLEYHNFANRRFGGVFANSAFTFDEEQT